MWKISVAITLVLALTSNAFAGDLADSIAKAVGQSAPQPAEAAPHRPMPKAYLYGGTALFAGGMAAALYGYLHNQNTGYSGYRGTTLVLNEASATNTVMGTVGIAAAFTGGTLLFLGQRHARRSATVVSAGPGAVTLARRLTW